MAVLQDLIADNTATFVYLQQQEQTIFFATY
jgi:hypothetical protein